MSRDHYDHILNNNKFHNLVRQRTKLSWTLSAIIFVVYYGFILTIAFFPQSLGVPISVGSIISWGILAGLGIIFLTFIITGIYVYRANTIYDKLLKDIIDASNTHVDGLQG